jgi:ATP-dependent exoDNAse (exonuclease V) beta subunit
LSLVEFAADQEKVFLEIDREPSLTREESIFLKEKIQSVLSHESTSAYFSEAYEVLNEQKILMPNGSNLIPDRLLIKDGAVTIIDYKTGGRSEQHRNQIETYTRALEAMDYTIKERLLIYTDHIEVVHV